MHRRDFVRLAGTGLTAGALAEAGVAAQVASRPAAAPSSRARMKAGTQHGDSDAILGVLAGFGVNHICSRLPSPQMGSEGSVEALTKRREHVESFGLTLDMVTVSEMLEKPGEQIFDVIRYFGTRKKIFSVHFRNIAGGFLDFRETFIDDGDVDMLKAMRVYRDVGYDGMMMPDHVPGIEGDTGNLQGFAFAVGYIKPLIAAVAAES